MDPRQQAAEWEARAARAAEHWENIHAAFMQRQRLLSAGQLDPASYEHERSNYDIQAQRYQQFLAGRSRFYDQYPHLVPGAQQDDPWAQPMQHEAHYEQEEDPVSLWDRFQYLRANPKARKQLLMIVGGSLLVALILGAVGIHMLRSAFDGKGTAAPQPGQQQQTQQAAGPRLDLAAIAKMAGGKLDKQSQDDAFGDYQITLGELDDKESSVKQFGLFKLNKDTKLLIVEFKTRSDAEAAMKKRDTYDDAVTDTLGFDQLIQGKGGGGEDNDWTTNARSTALLNNTVYHFLTFGNTTYAKSDQLVVKDHDKQAKLLAAIHEQIS